MDFFENGQRTGGIGVAKASGGYQVAFWKLVYSSSFPGHL